MGLSQRAYARHRGVSPPAVKKAIDSKRIVKALLPDGTINPVIADQEWATNTNPEKQANGWKGAQKTPRQEIPAPAPAPAGRKAAPKGAATVTPPTPPASAPARPGPAAHDAESSVPKAIDYNLARTHTEVWKAKTAELEYKKAAGEYVPADEVKIGIFKVLTVLRTHVMGIHSKCRLQADLPPQTVALIEHLCRGGLEDAAKSLQELVDGAV